MSPIEAAVFGAFIVVLLLCVAAVFHLPVQVML